MFSKSDFPANLAKKDLLNFSFKFRVVLNNMHEMVEGFMKSKGYDFLEQLDFVEEKCPYLLLVVIFPAK